MDSRRRSGPIFPIPSPSLFIHGRSLVWRRCCLVSKFVATLEFLLPEVCLRLRETQSAAAHGGDVSRRQLHLTTTTATVFFFHVLPTTVKECWARSTVLGLGFGLGQLGTHGQIYRLYGQKKLATYTITVDQSGKGNFTKVQSAIDAVPSNNKHWVCIKISSGTYRDLKGPNKEEKTKQQNYKLEAGVAASPSCSSNTSKGCAISVLAGNLQPGGIGYITAHGRDNPDESGGFIFNECMVHGTGLTYLGRAWRPYARVIFYREQLTFGEYGCYGAGANTSKRVSWERKLGPDMVQQFTSLNFIDSEGWLINQPSQL
ncbi:hypothetical protein ACLB2K_035091 [Fragaria x ananassa]